MSRLFVGVIGLTLLSLAADARADEAPEPTATTRDAAHEAADETRRDAAHEGTPLAARSSRRLALAPSDARSPLGFKVIASALVVLGAGVWLRKKRAVSASRASARIDVLGRASVGVRSEIVVLEVEHTRLLVGVTPSAIQTLAVLDAASSAELAEPFEASTSLATVTQDEAAALPEVELGVEAARVSVGAEPAGRLRSLLDGREPRTPGLAAPRATPPRSRASASKIAQIAGQARGLLLALDEPLEARERPALDGLRSSERNASRSA